MLLPYLQPTLGLQFLAPLAGLIAAAIAIPALLFFYFLKLRRKPLRVSSTLFWEQAVSDLQVNAPFRWIRPSLLLVIQLLALLCLLLAIARPAIDGGVGEGRVVILIDASASMNAIDEPDGVSRLELAKQSARNYLDALPAETQVMIIEITGQTRTLTNFTRNRGMTSSAIESVSPSDQPATLAEALEVLAAFATGPGEDQSGSQIADGDGTGPPRVVLFSDGSFPDAPEDRAAPGLGDIAFDFVYIGPEPDAQTDSPGSPPLPTASENVGVIGLAIRRDIDDPSIIRVFTRLQSTFRRERTVTLRCSIDGEVVAVSSPTLEAATADGTSNSIVAVSESSHTFDINSPGGGLLAVTVGIEDALAADNSAWLLLPPPESLNILMIRPDGSLTNGTANLAFALETVTPSPQQVRVITESQARADGVLGGPSEAPFDLIVYDSVSPPTVPAIPAIYFDAVPPLPSVRLERAETPQSTEFLYWRRSHPVMRNVIPDGVLIYQRPRLILAESEQPEETESGPVVRTTELASDPSPLIALLEHGRTRSVVVGFNLDSTNWWQDRSFPIFIQNAVDFLAIATTSQTGRAITTAEPLRVDPEEAAGGATLVDADGNALRIPAPTGSEPILLPPLRRAGLYELLPSEDSSASPRLVAVNLMSPFESLSSGVPSIEIGGDSTSSISTDGLARREIWSWFILAAVILLTLEWFIFDRKMRI